MTLKIYAGPAQVEVVKYALNIISVKSSKVAPEICCRQRGADRCEEMTAVILVQWDYPREKRDTDCTAVCRGKWQIIGHLLNWSHEPVFEFMVGNC